MPDLRTTYMGLSLAHPVIASASPLTKNADGVKRLEDANAAAVVMFSLFEEQLRWEQDSLRYLTETTAAASPRRSATFRSPIATRSAPTSTSS